MGRLDGWKQLGLYAGALLILAAIIVSSVSFGSKSIDAATVRAAFFQFDADNMDHQIIRHSRLPRVLGALLIGAFLAISGALMQGMTRNDLASPSIMGVTDGSAFMITLCMVVWPDSSGWSLIVCSMIGSAIGTGIVFGLASVLKGGMNPVRLAIIGTIIGTFLSSLAAAMAVYFQVSQNISFWYNARLHQMDPALVKLAIPFAVVGLALAVLVSRSVTIFALGDETAASLGQRTRLIKGLTMLSVVLLTGVAVALAGKIGFVGLLIPHISRFFVGVDYRKVIPCAAVFGGLFLALCDLISRFLNHPFETPIGVVTALFGVPFFLYLIRRRGGGKHA